MACGLPVCGVNDGAMSELTTSGENSLLITTNGDAFWKHREYNTSQFADNLNSIMQNLESYSKKSRATAEKSFSLETMAQKYIELF
jgi:glycosyltransferase involved in cell wall biosynthesis